MKKQKLKERIASLEKQKEVLTLLLKLQTIKIETLKDENAKLQRYQNGILPNKHKHI